MENNDQNESRQISVQKITTKVPLRKAKKKSINLNVILMERCFPFFHANAPTIIAQTFEVVLSPTFYGVFVCHFGWIVGKAYTQLNSITIALAARCASDTLYT